MEGLGGGLVWMRATAHNTGSHHCGNAYRSARWKLLETLLHSTSQGAAIAPGTAASSAGGPGRSGDRRGDSLSATRWGRTCAAAKAWTRSAGSCSRPTARSWKGRRGPHVRGTTPGRSFPGSHRGGALGTPCTRTHVSHQPCAPEGRQGHAFLTGFGNRTENQETTTRQLVKSWLYLSLIHLISVMPLGRPQ